jgi:hypothetical protein
MNGVASRPWLCLAGKSHSKKSSKGLFSGTQKQSSFGLIIMKFSLPEKLGTLH